MKHSIRIRLIVWIAVLLLPLSGGAAWLLAEVFGGRLLHDIDVALEEEAETVAALVAKPIDEHGIETLLNHIAAENDLGVGKAVAVWHDERVIAEAPPGAAAALESDDPGLRRARASENGASGPLTVVIGVSATAALHAKRRLGILLAFGAPVFVLLAVGGLWIVAGRALAPLQEASRQLERINLDNLSARVPLTDGRDEVGRMVVVLNRMLQRLEDAVAQLHRFTADAAHELRTPLAVLRTGLEVALSQGRSADEYRQTLEEALAATERISRLADDLLTLARLESCDEPRAAEAVALDEMMRDLADAWDRVAAVQGVGLCVSVESGLEVQGSWGDLYRLFNNLVENAVRHSPRGGAVSLAVHAAADGVEATVSDDGPGIPTGEAERVFDRFHRGNGAAGGGGAGLGLSIAREIARTHGGRITLSNRDGGGCTARVTLPQST